MSVRWCAVSRRDFSAMSAAPGGRTGLAASPTNAVSLKSIEVPQALQSGEKFIKWDEVRCDHHRGLNAKRSLRFNSTTPSAESRNSTIRDVRPISPNTLGALFTKTSNFFRGNSGGPDLLSHFPFNSFSVFYCPYSYSQKSHLFKQQIILLFLGLIYHCFLTHK